MATVAAETWTSSPGRHSLNRRGPGPAPGPRHVRGVTSEEDAIRACLQPFPRRPVDVHSRSSPSEHFMTRRLVKRRLLAFMTATALLAVACGGVTSPSLSDPKEIVT